MASFLILVLLVTLCACSVTPQQHKFQNAFLPPSPHPVAFDLNATEPPVVPPNAYLNELPSAVSTTPHLAPNATNSDQLIEKAQQHFQQGKKYYQVKDGERARNEFDTAIDLMLDASDNPSDRQLYESKLEEMV